MALFFNFSTQVTKGGDIMLLFVLSYILCSVISVVITRLYLKYFKGYFNVGQLVIIEQENEQPSLLLEINKGYIDEIKPGKEILLEVVTRD